MKDFVIADPYLSETRLGTYSHCPFLILACDGVFDVMTDAEAVDLILQTYLRNGPFEDAARLLVRASYINLKLINCFRCTPPSNEGVPIILQL